MKPAGLSLDLVAYAAPQEHIAVNAAERRDFPWDETRECQITSVGIHAPRARM